MHQLQCVTRYEFTSYPTCMLQHVTRTSCFMHVGCSLALLHLDGCLYLLRHDACCSQAAKLSSVEAKTVFITVQKDPCGQPHLGVASDEALKVWSWCCHHCLAQCSLLRLMMRHSSDTTESELAAVSSLMVDISMTKICDRLPLSVSNPWLTRVHSWNTVCWMFMLETYKNVLAPTKQIVLAPTKENLCRQ